MDTRNPSRAGSYERRRNRQKAPDDWVTGGQRMTAAQATHLRLLCEHAGEAFEAKLTKAQASKRIHALRARSVFGRHLI